MNNIVMVQFGAQHKTQVADIYNAYIATGTEAFPQEAVTPEFFDFLLEMPEGYLVYVLIDNVSSHVVGFAFISPFHPLPTFKKNCKH